MPRRPSKVAGRTLAVGTVNRAPNWRTSHSAQSSPRTPAPVTLANLNNHGRSSSGFSTQNFCFVPSGSSTTSSALTISTGDHCGDTSRVYPVPTRTPSSRALGTAAVSAPTGTTSRLARVAPGEYAGHFARAPPHRQLGSARCSPSRVRDSGTREVCCHDVATGPRNHKDPQTFGTRPITLSIAGSRDSRRPQQQIPGQLATSWQQLDWTETKRAPSQLIKSG